MDLQAASITMALLMKKEIDFYNRFLKQRIEEDKIHDEKYQELWRQYQYIQANTREFGNRLAANPNFFNIIESWLVTIDGKGGVAEDSLKEAEKTADVETLVEKTSNLAGSVKEFLASRGYSRLSMGAGTGGWDMSARCNDIASRELCRDLYQKFTKAIDLGMITISRRFSGHCIPGLYTWDDAKRLLNIYGDEFKDL